MLTETSVTMQVTSDAHGMLTVGIGAADPARLVDELPEHSFFTIYPQSQSASSASEDDMSGDETAGADPATDPNQVREQLPDLRDQAAAAVRTLHFASRLLEQIPGLQQACRLDAGQLDACQLAIRHVLAATQACIGSMEAAGVVQALQQLEQQSSSGNRRSDPADGAPPQAGTVRLSEQHNDDTPGWWPGALLALSSWDRGVRDQLIGWHTAAEARGSSGVVSGCLHALLTIPDADADAQLQAMSLWNTRSFITFATAVMSGIIKEGNAEHTTAHEVRVLRCWHCS